MQKRRTPGRKTCAHGQEQKVPMDQGQEKCSTLYLVRAFVVLGFASAQPSGWARPVSGPSAIVPATKQAESKAGNRAKGGEPPLPTPQALREYILKEYCMPRFTAQLGDPTQARYVLIVFTSATCPMCRAFHTQVLPKLVAERPQDLAIVLRDYPSDPLALRAVGALWSRGLQGHALGQQAFDQGVLFQGTPQESLAALEAFLTQRGAAPSPYLPAKSVMQHAFDRHNQDYEHMGIREVPTAFWVEKKPGGVQAWHVETLAFPLDSKALLNRAGGSSGQPSRAP